MGELTYKGSFNTCCEFLFCGGSSRSVTAMVSMLYWMTFTWLSLDSRLFLGNVQHGRALIVPRFLLISSDRDTKVCKFSKSGNCSFSLDATVRAAFCLKMRRHEENMYLQRYPGVPHCAAAGVTGTSFSTCYNCRANEAKPSNCAERAFPTYLNAWLYNGQETTPFDPSSAPAEAEGSWLVSESRFQSSFRFSQSVFFSVAQDKHVLQFCHMLSSTSAAVTTWYHVETHICMVCIPESSRLTTWPMNNDELFLFFWEKNWKKKVSWTRHIHCRSEAGFLTGAWDGSMWCVLSIPLPPHHL